ncbi:MAG: ImmA/IrrE family metallo-endopeptidase [Candidatus Aenigmarchaeota archaeon]|nr:ImmA/IrrE family metallo-endopeptidase [Candidatus Aenigmarchaeota archaeon]
MSTEIPYECYKILAQNLNCTPQDLRMNIEREISRFFYEIQKDYKPPFSVVEPANLAGIYKFRPVPFLNGGGGALYPNSLGERDFKILMGDEDPLEEKRFVVAHETGHSLLEWNAEGHKKVIPDGERYEDASDYLARIILMPAWDFTERAKELNYNTPELSKLYVCPKYAVEERIKDLGVYKFR